ncbi:spermatogenesis-associated protein 48 isoform X2 [Ictalurus furcatus]|uniref:spermatogenesis-associated protein 48 isoform X2 n=1 Tax=Ictalurus furcatus TaxID=66913 RepID=UPI002350BCAF|nr:spermatogenesis-associated protein 48 isoform X2 [Ictalurus furcatus]
MLSLSSSLRPRPRAPLAPLRDDVSLTEPHSGLLSPSDTFPHTVCSAAPWDPRAARHPAHTPAFGPAAGTRHTSASKPRDSRLELTDRKYHSSRERPDPGSTSLLGCEDLKRDTCTSVPPKLMDKALRYIYTSEAQRGYENIDQDSKLKPPLCILEKMADPVSQRFTLKRYHSRPELWQTIGPHWNRHQIRASYNVKKPFSFTSPCPKSGQIPLYCGVIGSENMDNIEIPEKDFIPLTVRRTVLPPDTPTAHRPTIPGYTGKALHDRPHTVATSQPSSMLTHQTTGSSSTPSSYGRQAPLSRMLITVKPGNPFLQPKAPTPPIYSKS